MPEFDWIRTLMLQPEQVKKVGEVLTERTKLPCPEQVTLPKADFVALVLASLAGVQAVEDRAVEELMQLASPGAPHGGDFAGVN